MMNEYMRKNHIVLCSGEISTIRISPENLCEYFNEGGGK